MSFIQPKDETFDFGADTRTGANDANYQVPLRFTGTLAKVTAWTGPPQAPLGPIETERLLKQKSGELRAQGAIAN